MCDGMAMLSSMQKRKPVVRCLKNSSCWCNFLERKLIHSDDITDCMSPEEMLKSKSQCFNERDLVYLKSLLGREFITE